jgi:DGQHR domain-containing protein
MAISRARKLLERTDDAVDDAEVDREGRISYTASLITQGTKRFFTLSMPSDILGETCIVEPRNEEPIEGFQRALDERRARDIANYIDSGFGTIPSSIVLSAQPVAALEYRRTTRTLSFAKDKRSFLILDGQHRVFGFMLAESKLRVPVVIYNNLTRVEECRLFMDINTKQRPVPNELLLDIKKLAERENAAESQYHDVFDAFHTDSKSPLFGLMSPSERKKGKLSRVTFNNAMKSINEAFSDADSAYTYQVMSAYLTACMAGLRSYELQSQITNPTLFRALMQVFPTVAERVADRHQDDPSAENFAEIVGPFFQRVKKSDLQNPGTSHKILAETFAKALRSGFSLGRFRAG